MRIRLLVATLAVVAVAACSPTAPSPVPGAPSAAPAADAPTPTGGTSSAGPVANPDAGSAITITGARQTAITGTGFCIMDTFSGEDFELSFETDEDDFWMLDVSIRKFAGPATYETAQSSVGKATIFLTDGLGHSFDAAGGDGTITVAPDALGGTLDVSMTNDDTGERIHAVGSWTCSGS